MDPAVIDRPSAPAVPLADILTILDRIDHSHGRGQLGVGSVRDMLRLGLNPADIADPWLDGAAAEERSN